MILSLSFLTFCIGMANGLLLSYIIEDIGRVAINIAKWVLTQVIRPLTALKGVLERAGTSDPIVENVPDISLYKWEPEASPDIRPDSKAILGIGDENRCPKHQTIDVNCPLCFIGEGDY